jgi:hypothetical protein
VKSPEAIEGASHFVPVERGAVANKAVVVEPAWSMRITTVHQH